MMACFCSVKLSLVLTILVWVGSVCASNEGLGLDAQAPQPMILAGEIVLAPPKNDVSASDTEASRQRETAREYRKKGHSSTAPDLIIVPDDDIGVVAPRHGSNAAENASRARTYRQGDTASGAATPIIVAPEALPEKPASAIEGSSQSARNNRARAIEYRNGDHSVAVTGQNGLPTIDCSATDNVAGRIGDDTRSGSVVILIQGRNQVKVRCR